MGISMEAEQQSKLQLVEIEEDTATLNHTISCQDDEVSSAKITHYALVDSPSSNIVRVKGRIKNHEVVSLIDLGSTHNFLDADIAPAMKQHIDTSQILEIKVADGSIIKTLGVFHDVLFCVPRYKFVVDMNVLHLGGYDIVLGTKWLSTLSEIAGISSC